MSQPHAPPTGDFGESEDTAWKQTLVALTKHSFSW
jgi:hypothetical protein